MDIKIYKEEERGQGNYDWLKAKYSFSFANYYNPERTNFGALRVLNDDVINPSMGFGKHPHNNMEIISIPLKGSLKHKDSMSDEWFELHSDEVQVMTAGSGIMHSERNNSAHETLNLFQIWIQPKITDINPVYNQKKFDANERKDRLQILVTSNEEDSKNSLKINQDAKISRIDLSKNKRWKYSLKSSQHGVYMVVIDGEVEVEDFKLSYRDAAGVFNTSDFEINATEDSDLLFIEVPMKF